MRAKKKKPEAGSGAGAPCAAGSCAFLSGEEGAEAELSGLPQPVCRLISELQILYHTASTLQGGGDLKSVLGRALEDMGQTLGLFHGSLRVLNRPRNEVMVEVSWGLSAAEALPQGAKLAAEIATRVLESGLPVIVPDTRRPQKRVEAAALAAATDAALALGEVGLLCVPVSDQNETLGAITIISRQQTRLCLESNLRLLTLMGQLIARALKIQRQTSEQLECLRQENERLQHELQRHFRPDNMIGNSRAMQVVYHSIEQVAGSNTTVLIRGESGVGKELVAHAIHQRSPRAAKAFVKINCAALPETIVESELFGHERGAFTGAIAMRKGRFELAHGGTIFLDEIGELPLQTQAKLLRILQEREFERVGGSETLKCDVRVIAATNRPLEESVEQGKFRQDLYYRLNVFPIYVPALRERKTDILQLADFFVEKYNAANGRAIQRISTPAIDMLMAYHWPGNVRELENCIERATLLASDDVVHAYHLPPTLQTPRPEESGARSTLQAAIDGFEREMIIDALKANRGNMAAAARQLGLTERIMGLRVKKHALDPASFRV